MKNTDCSNPIDTMSIYVAAHKKVQLNLPEGYRICQVNSEKNGKWAGSIAHDNDSPDNISLKNDRYSELTALYELWKNNDSDIKGLAHYRRFFAEARDIPYQIFKGLKITEDEIQSCILDKGTIVRIMKTKDMIVEFPWFPWLMNAHEDLLRFVYPEDIGALGNVIHKFFPDYEENYMAVLKSTHISYLNMFIARKETFDEYCKWLFGVLFKLENEISIEEYDDQHKRIFGYLGEVLLNVWICRHKPRIKYAYRLTISQTGTKAFFIWNSNAAYKLYNTYMKFDRRKLRKNEEWLLRAKGLCENQYAFSLDCDYRLIKNPDDAENYFKHFDQGCVSREKISVNGSDHVYICLKTECEDYECIKSNNRCIVTCFTDSISDAKELVNGIYEKYSATYTVNIRIITNSPQVRQYGDRVPEIYVYEMEAGSQ